MTAETKISMLLVCAHALLHQPPEGDPEAPDLEHAMRIFDSNDVDQFIQKHRPDVSWRLN